MNTAANPTAEASAPAATTTTVAPHELPDFDPMKAAMEADAATELGGEQGKPAAAPQTTETAKPGAPGDKKPETKKPITDANDKTAKPGEEGNDSAFTKAQKERVRQETVLKNFQQEKEAFRQEKARYDAELQGLRRELQQIKQQHAAPAKDEHGATAEAYDRLAKDYHDKGDTEMAQAARARADKLRRQAPAAEPEKPAVEAFDTPEFQARWKQEADALMAEDPVLADANHPLTKAANTLLGDKTWQPLLRARPEGVRAAVEVARLMQKAAEAAATQEKLTAAQAEVERLTKLTQPRGSHPSAPPNTAPKPVGELTGDDVMAAARAADGGG